MRHPSHQSASGVHGPHFKCIPDRPIERSVTVVLDRHDRLQDLGRTATAQAKEGGHDSDDGGQSVNYGRFKVIFDTLERHLIS